MTVGNRTHYPKPSAMGGTLIRKVLAVFREQGFALPICEPIAIATSGGVDSMVMAHLIARYGRKIIDPKLITLIHFDHQWRKESATIEKAGVKKLAENLQVGFESIRLQKPSKATGENLEDHARKERLSVFEGRVGGQKEFRYVLTGHHQDDVAETLFWRFLRGEFLENNKGILFIDNDQLRPMLKVTKQELYEYARQEKLRFYEDPTNQDTDRMRAFLRAEIFPKLEKFFPAFSKRIAGYATRMMSEKALTKHAGFEAPLISTLEALTDAKLNRSQRGELQKLVRPDSIHKKLSLARGLVIERQKRGLFIEILDQPIKAKPAKTRR